MADNITNRKYDSHGNLIEWTDGRGWTHVDTKQISKDLVEWNKKIEAEKTPSYGEGMHDSPALTIMVILSMLGLAAVYLAILIFLHQWFLNWLGTIVLAIILYGGTGLAMLVYFLMMYGVGHGKRT